MAVGRMPSPRALLRRLDARRPASPVPAPPLLSRRHLHPPASPRQQTPPPASRSASAPRATPTPSPYADLFTLSDIPLSAFEAVVSRNAKSFRDPPETYYGVAQTLSRAVRRGASPWAAASSFTGRDAVPAETIHQAACIMRQIAGPRGADAFATALWSTASEMGYRPSTLSLARQLVRSGAYGRVPQLRRVEARFKGLVSGGRDADALTAEGELLLARGRLDAAAAALTRALRLGGDFEWRPHCRLCLARTYLRMQRSDEARRLLEVLSEEGVVEADAELGEMLKGSDVHEARQRMFTAACNGRREMFTRLAELELQTLRGGTDGDEDARLWAVEWSRLADGREG
ncbi:Tetratricopeptide-like helical [Metarhizium album ARSEF 1941]|uniref:Tetratricopeptide-like helical n=1 Tax=Metarhizium album (strain ARSEF 1941) TaxID=1081103 RepID=A0A0B2X194_METAS|nr:Tetratricopeptide-like helical [Metarhizium album ARSEF 1941]KHN99442.1 Tetratricopeptide-like helical [Metarhizium album ARSEF 1941]